MQISILTTKNISAIILFMLSSVYLNEINENQIKEQIIKPLEEIYSGKFGTKKVIFKNCQDKYGNYFFLLLCDREYYLNLDAYTIENKDGTLIKHNIGSLQACEGTDIINGKLGSCLYISNLYAKHKNINIGSNLVNFVKEIAKEKEINFISLTSLPSSLPFYKKLGFSTYIDLNLKQNNFRLFYNSFPHIIKETNSKKQEEDLIETHEK